MKKEIKKVYQIEVVKCNFGEPFLTYKTQLKSSPSDEDIVIALDKCDKQYPDLIHYETKIHTSEYYEVSTFGT